MILRRFFCRKSVRRNAKGGVQREKCKSRNAKGGVQGEMQEVESIAERETSTHPNTLVGQRPRADPSCLRQHSARGQGGGIPARKISSDGGPCSYLRVPREIGSPEMQNGACMQGSFPLSEVSSVICWCFADSGT